MNNRLRPILFWLHLGVGVLLGLVVAIMAATGAALAFEAQLRDWAEGDSRAVTVPADATRLPLDELLRRAQAAHPGTVVTALVPAQPAEAVRISFGRDDGAHVDPYTGQVRPLAGQTTRHVLGVLIRWHRFLGAAGEGRALGQAITGVSNAGFLFLALSGLVLWWPRRWNTRALRGLVWFKRGLGGRARDFNWHNVIGFWSLPALIVITTSGLMISYRPVANLVFKLAGEAPPPPGGAPRLMVPRPSLQRERVPLEALVGVARAQVPAWSSLLVRLGSTGPAGTRLRPSGAGERGAPAVTISVKSREAGPPFASAQLSFDPWTGQLLRHERFAEQSTGRRVRTWMRFLHTGEALGAPGQLLAGLVSLGTLVLVYTGLGMALRRLRPVRSAPSGRVP
jgi:uncharacterized iron-regulated membrane protein